MRMLAQVQGLAGSKRKCSCHTVQIKTRFKMSFLPGLTVLLLALLTTLPYSRSHPQCLDFQAPYDDSQVSYCNEYKGFGCCGRVTDNRARKRVDHLLTRTRAGRQVGAECEPYLRNISCTACSPYVAHLFDVEDAGEGRTFPWLCRDYCEEAYQHCRRILLRMYKMKTSDYGLLNNPKTHDKLVLDSKKFCEQVIPNDSPYCYPRVLNGPQIGGSTVEPSGDLNCLCALPVATGLRNPLLAVHSGDQTGRLFIGEQVGVIRILAANNTLLTTPFLNIQSKVLTSSRRGDERGFLGLAFHPNYKENGRFYVYYSVAINFRHFSRVSEFTVSSDDSNVANANSEREILRISQPRSNHNGGMLLFKDGYLLVFFGDGGGAGDGFGNRGNGQNKRTWLGSVIRIDVDHKDPGREYSVPPDNPFVNDSTAAPEIYAYGLRNPWRCSIDRGERGTGDGRGRIFCGDVGQNRFEEVDIIEKGGNYGWRAYEGNTCFDRNLCNEEQVGPVISPIDVYDHQSVGVSVTGGYVYRGCLFPNLRGLYIYGDYGSGTLLALTENKNNGTWTRRRLCMGGEDVCTGELVGQDRARFVLSFGEDEDGELFVLTTANASPLSRSGVVYQLIDPARRARPIECKRSIRKLNFRG